MRIRAIVLLFFGALLGSAAAARAQLTVDADTVALWHFDETSGLTAYDATANHLDLALERYPADGSQGAQLPTWSPHGCFGGGLRLVKGDSDSFGGYASLTAQLDFPQNAYTVEMWIATTTGNADPFVMGFLQCDVEVDYEGKIDFRAGDGNDWGTSVISSTAVNDGLWHYVVVSYDGATERVFVDGQPDGSAAFTGTTGTIADPTYVGGRPSNDFVDGTMDEVRLSNVARSASEIADRWTALSTQCPEPSSGAEIEAVFAVLLVRGRTRGRRHGST
jgi:hypothetical protein